MRSFVCVFLLVAVASASVLPKLEISPVKDSSGDRIISGTQAQIGQFPWQVANSFKRSSSVRSFCGAALICDQWVLTAAQCAQDAISFKLTFGVVNRTQENEFGRVVMEATEKYIHPEYNPWTLNNDVALIRLPAKIGYTDNIQPIRLGRNQVNADLTTTISGWGRVNDDTSTGDSEVLNYADLITISNEDCEEAYNSLVVRKSTLCCRGLPELGYACNDDSGGPLVRQADDRQYEHVGIASFVSELGCASGKPAGFVRTANYIDWITETIRGSCKLP